MKSNKVAIVLFNLGGPDCLKSVPHFLFNLFYDRAILRISNPIRYLLAQGLSRWRKKEAQKIYATLGGKSPLLENTLAQGQVLEELLHRESTDFTFKSFVCMRYWHPMTEQVAREVSDFGADHIILLSLYPQYSTTTIESSLAAWMNEVRNSSIAGVATQKILCYPTMLGFTKEIACKIKAALESLSSEEQSSVRLLFSAHSLPQKIIKAGDPYQRQVEESVAAVMFHLGRDYDYQICYQSRVGPVQWIGPSTESELERVSRDKKSVIVIPISFVSEHSETLYELDIQYKNLAEKLSIPNYIRIATVSDSPQYIRGLAGLVFDAIGIERSKDLTDV